MGKEPMVGLYVRIPQEMRRRLRLESERRTKRERRDVGQAEIVRKALDRELGLGQGGRRG